VRPLHGQRGLTYPGGSRDDRHPRAGRDAVGVTDCGVQPGQFGGPPDEAGRGQGELCGYRRRRRRRRRRGDGDGRRRRDGRVVTKDGPLQRLQLRAGIQTEIGGQPTTDVAVDGQRFASPPAAVQGEHELRHQPFPGRVCVDQAGQLTE
jgi:hypothetical protein